MQLEHSIFFDFNDDETDIKVAPKLLQLQFPCADEGMCIIATDTIFSGYPVIQSYYSLGICRAL